ncbi:MAG: 30S ribosomal protein S6 [Alphaproteobacteria bacterium]|nr:30S ribosomal protein S6 [Alphaproteobacteria bacterium]
MPLYETVFIARQDLTPAQVETLTGEIETTLKAQGGKVTKTEQWGLRTLAYRINKNKKGHYTLVNIDAPAAAIAEMERTMRIHDDVMRYITIRVDEHEEGPSAILRRANDDERPSGGFGDRGDRSSRSGDRGGDRGDRGGDRGFRPRPPRSEEGDAA